MTDPSITIFGDAEASTIAQMERAVAAEPGAKGVLCADSHLGYSVPIGGVVAYRDHVSPNGVGYDIACGNCAVQTVLKASEVDVPRVMDEIWNVISFGIGQKNSERISDHPVFEEIAHSPVVQQRSMLEMAKQQLGTVGSGNHYVDLFEDRYDGLLWVGVHFGSRGFGHKTASGFLALAAGKSWGERTSDSMDAPPVLLRLDQPIGQDYLEAMRIAGNYAYAGRAWVCSRIVSGILGAGALETVHNHHNFAWHEKHNGQHLMVIRKGATPAFPTQRGFIGGSMGEDAVIIEGVDSPQSITAFYSTVHGAGRSISRRKAAGKAKMRKSWHCGNYRMCPQQEVPINEFYRGKEGQLPLCPTCGGKMRPHSREEIISTGSVDWSWWQEEVKRRGVELRGGGADEAPECYKRLPDVLEAHAGTIRILHRLRPIGVAMATRDTFDPFKD